VASNVPSCATCINRVPSDKIQERSGGKGFGVGICQALNEVTDFPVLETKAQIALHETKASRCGKWSTSIEQATTQELLTLQLGFPDAKRLAISATHSSDSVQSCRSCVNFIPSEVAAEKFGTAAPVCGAKAEILHPSRLSSIARSCDYRVPFGAAGHVLEAVKPDDIRLLPEYHNAFLVQDSLNAFGSSVDPLDYPTDREVTQDHRDKGIKAWRKVIDAKGERFTFLPVFDPKYFSDEERARIPRPGDKERPELYIDHDGLVYMATALWLDLEMTFALWGRPGTGKTELLRYMAFLMQVPFVRINITGSTEVDELVGKTQYHPEKGTYFQYGTLPNRWNKPGVLCIDEPNVGPPDVWQVLRPLTDNSSQLVITQNDGEEITRHDQCFLGFAMNPAWDALNVGTQQLGAADVSRIMHFYIELPSDELERKIISTHVKAETSRDLSARDLNTIMAIANDIRQAVDSGSIPMTWGLREQIKVAKAWHFFDPHTVYRLAAANFLEPEQREVVMAAVSSNVRSKR